MTREITADKIRRWIDDDLVTDVERIPDEAAEFNLAVEVSNILIHVVQRYPGGPLLIGQQIEYGDEIRSRIQNLSEREQSEVVARVRETLTAVPVIYGFHDRQGNNVRFVELNRIFLEHRIYPGTISQQSLMAGLVDVWKAMRYLDDLVTLIDAVED